MTNGSQLTLPGVDRWLVDAVNRMVRGQGPGDLAGVLVSVGDEVVVDGTMARFRCHFLSRDGNDRPRVQYLGKLLAENVIDYCIPRSRIAEAHRHLDETGSTDRFVKLAHEATALFTKLVASGEGGELLLFVLMERLLGIPQLLSKMSLKTNSQMHVHGTDGIHIKALDNGNLGIYWCESKLYASAANAISNCFTSIAPFLLDEGNGPSRRDFALARQFVDSGSEELDELLVRYLSDDSADATRREIRGAALIGFDLAAYPQPHEADGITIRDEVAQSMADWMGRVKTRINHERIVSFDIEVFCLPLPSVEAFRAALRQELGISP